MRHVTTHPPAPWRSATGTLEVHGIPVWQDNYAWLLICTATGATAVVDAPEAEPVLAACVSRGVTLGAIFNTHTHADHVGINRDLARRGRLAGLRVVGAPGVGVPGLTEPVDEGATVELGAVRGRVWRTEDHQDGHLTFLFDDLALCGDTLFAGGCGYLFDGPPAKMHASLTRLAGLDGATQVLCAHEYTEDNLAFARFVDPHNEALSARAAAVARTRALGHATVPSSVAEERATNPFLRSADPALRAHIAALCPEEALTSDLDFFAATRRLKDRKAHRA